MIHIALLTSADRGVLLSGTHGTKTHRGLLVRDLRIYQETGDDGRDTYTGEVYLYDGKAKGRTRTVPLSDLLCRELLPLCLHKKPDDPVFNLTYSALDSRWKRVKKAAGLPELRFKDLRAQTAIYGEETGVPQTVIQRTMGHGQDAMTRRYQQRRAALSTKQAEAMEATMLQDETSGSPVEVKLRAPIQAPNNENAEHLKLVQIHEKSRLTAKEIGLVRCPRQECIIRLIMAITAIFAHLERFT